MFRGRGRSTRYVPLIVPGPAVITTTRSAMPIASSRSCVTNTTDAPVEDHRSSSSFSMSARVCTSSALNGSSMSRIFGWLMRV